jgi:poly-gamma-glutamate synthesis protein (capsule biosynthesis protein)
VERNDHPEKYQRTLAKQYIDAGADAVIGCHPHVMQGIEFYEGKPIAYSLGNFWFNNSSKESGMFKLYLDPEGTVRTQILPVMNKNTLTYLLTKDAEKTDYFNFIEELSYGVKIDENGFITEEK